MEAYFYFDYLPAEGSLTTLKCPFILTSRESGQVTVRYSNTSSLTLAPQFHVQISASGLEFRTLDSNPSIAPGETRQLHWAIDSQDVIFGHLILAQVYQSPVYGNPDLVGRCGTLWVDLPQLTGRQLFTGVLAGNLLLVGLGWGLWIASRPPKQGTRIDATGAMLALTVIALLGTIAAISGWWPVGVGCLVLGILLTLSTLGYMLQRG